MEVEVSEQKLGKTLIKSIGWANGAERMDAQEQRCAGSGLSAIRFFLSMNPGENLAQMPRVRRCRRCTQM
jgi:hypothetical protein